MPTARNRFTNHGEPSAETLVQAFPDRDAIQSRLNELRHELEQVNRMIRVLEWASDEPAERG